MKKSHVQNNIHDVQNDGEDESLREDEYYPQKPYHEGTDHQEPYPEGTDHQEPDHEESDNEVEDDEQLLVFHDQLFPLDAVQQNDELQSQHEQISPFQQNALGSNIGQDEVYNCMQLEFSEQNELFYKNDNQDQQQQLTFDPSQLSGVQGQHRQMVITHNCVLTDTQQQQTNGQTSTTISSDINHNYDELSQLNLSNVLVKSIKLQDMKQDYQLIVKQTNQQQQVSQLPIQFEQEEQQRIQQNDPQIIKNNQSKSEITKNHQRMFSQKQQQVIREIPNVDHWAIKEIKDKFTKELEELELTDVQFLSEFKRKYKHFSILNGRQFVKQYQIQPNLNKKEKLLKLWLREFSFKFFTEKVLIYLLKDNIRVDQDRVMPFLKLVPDYLKNLTCLDENFVKNRTYENLVENLNDNQTTEIEIQYTYDEVSCFQYQQQYVSEDRNIYCHQSDNLNNR